jgi:hypothetical protein
MDMDKDMVVINDIQDGAVLMGPASVGDGLDMHLDEIEQPVLGTDVNDADPHQSEGPRFNRPTAAELCHLPWSNRTCLGTVTVEDEEDLEEFEDNDEPLDPRFMEHNIDEEGGLTAEDSLNEEFEQELAAFGSSTISSQASALV